MPCFGGLCFPDIIEIILGPPKHEKEKTKERESQQAQQTQQVQQTQQAQQTAKYWGVKLTVNGSQVVIPLDPRTMSGRIGFNVKTGQAVQPFSHEIRIQGEVQAQMGKTTAEAQASAQATAQASKQAEQESSKTQGASAQNTAQPYQPPKTDIAYIHVALMTSKFFVGVVNPTDTQVKVDIPGVIEVLEGELYDQNGVPLPVRTEFQPTTASLVVKPEENEHAWVKLDPEVPVVVDGRVYRVPKDFLVPVDSPGVPASYPGDTKHEKTEKEAISKFEELNKKVEKLLSQVSDIEGQLVVVRRSLTALNATVSQNFTKVTQMLEEIEKKLEKLTQAQQTAEQTSQAQQTQQQTAQTSEASQQGTSEQASQQTAEQTSSQQTTTQTQQTTTEQTTQATAEQTTTEQTTTEQSTST